MLSVTLPRIVSCFTALALALPAATAFAQTQAATTGRITGRIIDSRTGNGLPDVGIQVVGTTSGVASGLDGRFTLTGIAPGTVTLHARRLGFAPKTVTGILLDAGQRLEQNITLDPVTVSLSTQVVTASAERGTVSEALDRQRTAVGVVNAVTREQISKSPDGDAAQAMQRVSGVTVQDGRFIVVRGLGERYTTTSLNGARIPSPEPERKVVPLDLFPASLLESVATSKNFTPDQPGDFSGAQVDIRTREFPLRSEFQVSSSIGYNDAATAKPLVAAPSLGMEWLGFAGSGRKLPADRSSFRNSWTPTSRDGATNRSLGMLAGNSREFGRSRAGYIAALSYSWSQEVREDEIRAHVDPTDGLREIDRFEGTTGRASVLWGGILNASAMIGDKTRITLNNTYNRTADNDARREAGFSENLGARLLVDRIRFVERSVASSQLVADRQFGSRHKVNLSFTASTVSRSEPDRSEFVRVDPGNGAAPFWLDGSEAAVRTFGDLDEKSYVTSGDYSLQLGPLHRQHELKVGGSFRFTDRLARNSVFSLQSPSLGMDARRLSAEEIFDTPEAAFRVVPLAQGGSYGANEEVGAGYAMLQLNPLDRLQIIAGGRVERSSTIVSAEPTVGKRVLTNPVYNDFLPSLLLNMKLTDAQNLRLSATQTLARPEYRELAEVQYRDVIGGENILGNPSLRRTLIRNLDARWEWYPRTAEVFSIGVFAKHFQDPIERVFLATSGTRVVTFINADGANNFGIEIEARAGLDRLSPALTRFNVFSNVTLMDSKVELGGDPRVSVEERAMVGQAPIVVNAGLSFNAVSSPLTATLLFNHVGERIVTASQRPLPVTIEEARTALDLSLRFPVVASVAAKIDARNLLNQPYLQTQGGVTRESYRTGRVFTLGLSWQR